MTGECAGAALRTGSNWKMLSPGFQKGVYFQNGAGQLVFLGTSSIGAGPLNVVCETPRGWSWEKVGIQPDMPVHSDGKTFWIDRRIGFFFGNARPWNAPDLSLRRDFEVIAERTSLLEKTAKGNHPDGFASLIPCFSEMACGRSCAPNPLIRAAWQGIQSLFKWMQSGFSGAPRDHAGRIDRDAVSGLIGLGPGLTPSGDDLLGGIMIALHSMGYRELAGKLGESVLSLAPFLTHAISVAHLTCAARGEGSEALHDTISAWSVRSDDRLIPCLNRIGSIGYTSGWDAVTGIFLVMKALTEGKVDVEQRHEPF